MSLQLLRASDLDLPYARDLTRKGMLRYYCDFDLLWQDEAFDQGWGWREQWRVMDDDRRVGFCSLSQDMRALYIRELHISEEFQGQGVGTWVLRELNTWAGQRRLPWMRLTVFKTNPARQLYLREGFREEGEEECFIRMQRNVR
ncbi:GNAT family N-acetyltransferase [Pseudomonas putida]|uniref:N-acetyltransferase domain-containing protein n=1 Tax=Pseudomonas putida TaxID=303 RepID=A0A1Q9R2U1_PSEPU|nr:GNAT family N-acetyltransferase [Pseudomonas putida]OLS61709.1 hypothetical protein PSEMO_33880 [Pseudomonas putida]